MINSRIGLSGVLLIGAIGAAQAASSSIAADGTAADRAAIMAILQNSSAGVADPHVSPALDWENAFGIRYSDLKKRDAFFGAVVAPLQKNSTASTLEVKIRFVTRDVAVADEYWHVVGQLDLATHRPGPDRWGRTTYVFTHGGQGWTEVLERVADLRYGYYRHYDALPKAAAVGAAVLARYAGTYVFSDNGARRVIAVAGDHLTVTGGTKRRVAVPVSATEFLLFDPNDLAEYSRLRFAADATGGLRATVSDEVGDVVGTMARVK